MKRRTCRRSVAVRRARTGLLCKAHASAWCGIAGGPMPLWRLGAGVWHGLFVSVV